MVRRLKPGKLVAVVSDSFDLFQAIEQIWCEDLLEEVKQSGGTIVIRPDSGVPHEIVLEALRIIDRKIGCKKNMKGYKILPAYFRILQGDGINRESIRLILKTIIDAGFSASNIAFGCGGQLLQMVNRDTLKFAMKCSWILRDDTAVEVFKDPKTDHGKRSKKGIVDLVTRNGEYMTLEHLHTGQVVTDSILKLVYDNGRFYNRTTLDEIRARANRALVE
jgi:Nicotinic acid phosphoribosyltransferase